MATADAGGHKKVAQRTSLWAEPAATHHDGVEWSDVADGADRDGGGTAAAATCGTEDLWGRRCVSCCAAAHHTLLADRGCRFSACIRWTGCQSYGGFAPVGCRRRMHPVDMASTLARVTFSVARALSAPGSSAEQVNAVVPLSGASRPPNVQQFRMLPPPLHVMTPTGADAMTEVGRAQCGRVVGPDCRSV